VELPRSREKRKNLESPLAPGRPAPAGNFKFPTQEIKGACFFVLSVLVAAIAHLPPPGKLFYDHRKVLKMGTLTCQAAKNRSLRELARCSAVRLGKRS